MSELDGYASIPREVQRDLTISWKAKLVYLCLSSRANKYQKCWPSHETIAKESSCSVSSAKRALEELRELGLISWTAGKGGGKEGKPPNVYQLGAPSIRSERPETAEYQVTQTGVSVHSDLGTIQENDTKRTSSPGSLPPRQDVENICSHLLARMADNGTNATITDRWRNEARLLLDRDKRLEDEVHRVIDWCQSDTFWRSNILSMPKLREKYDQLRLRMPAGEPERRLDPRLEWMRS